LAREVADPVRRDRFLVLDRRGRARVGTRRVAAAEVALEGLARGRVVEHRAVRTGDRAELAAHALVVDHVLGAGRIDGDGAHRTRRHAPALIALRAGVGRVGRVTLERRDADDGLGRLVRAGLHVGAGDFAAETAGAPLGCQLQNFHARFFFPGRLLPRSRRSMNSSSGIAAIVIPATPPRAPSSTDTREILALSAASMIVTKSYGPRTAYC